MMRRASYKQPVVIREIVKVTDRGALVTVARNGATVWVSRCDVYLDQMMLMASDRVMRKIAENDAKIRS